MLEITIATGNPHKVEEIADILSRAGGDGVKLLGLKDLPANETLKEPEETGRTFEENAAIKALSYARQTGRLCLADDSGLEVDVLGGRPGVISSHYCTDGRETGMARAERDAANNDRLLRELDGIEPRRRSARFVCVMALASGGRVLLTVRGTCEGRIGVAPEVPRGANGFGYDPLFLVAPDLRETSAELSPAAKNTVSHRGEAVRELVRAMRASGLLT